MPVSLYADVHVPRAVVDQLRRRGIDVLTAVEDGQGASDDAALIRRALALGRVIFTHPLHVTIGQLVRDLELIALASDPQDWANVVEHLPY